MSVRSKVPSVKERPPHWVIVGCGYTGTHLAGQLLRQGIAVTATKTTQNGVERLQKQLPDIRAKQWAAGEDLSVVLSGMEPSVAVISVPPNARSGTLSGVENDSSSEQAMVEGCRRAKQIIYLSSTGVYGRGTGQWMDEDSPEQPLSARGERRLQAERRVVAHAKLTGVPLTILRIVGIYGPRRGVVARLRAGNYRLVNGGTTITNRVHVDDIAQATVLCGGNKKAYGQTFHVCDDTPSPSRDFAMEAAKRLGVANATVVDTSSVSPDIANMMTANRKISNAKIKALGFCPRFPSWKQGLDALLAD